MPVRQSPLGVVSLDDGFGRLLQDQHCLRSIVGPSTTGMVFVLWELKTTSPSARTGARGALRSSALVALRGRDRWPGAARGRRRHG